MNEAEKKAELKALYKIVRMLQEKIHSLEIELKETK